MLSGGDVVFSVSTAGCPSGCSSLFFFLVCVICLNRFFLACDGSAYGGGQWETSGNYGYGNFTFVAKGPTASGMKERGIKQ